MKIALVQMDIHWEDKERNRVKALNFIRQAAEQGVELLLFPEMSLTGFSMNVSNIGEDPEKEYTTIKWFKDAAKQHSLNIGFGYVEKRKDSVYGKNNFCTISSKGEILGTYSKIHPFSYGLESQFYTGGEEICFINISSLIISTFICYDLRFPEIFQIASRRASLITVAANWPKARREHWITLLKARAIENQCFVAGINRVGVGDNIEYCGDSMIIDPLGNLLAAADSSETLLVQDIDPADVFKLREIFRLKNDRREDLYCLLRNK